jgi:acyl carrier protein
MIDRSIVDDDLEYNSIPEWDSVAHMALVAEIELHYGLMLDTDDIIAMSSPKKIREILKRYTVSV